MATQKATFGAKDDGSMVTATWLLTATDDGAPIAMAEWADKSCQVGIAGDAFAAGTILIEGSNDGVTWTNLRAPDSTALSFTTAGLKQVLEMTAYIRPRASVAVTNVAVVIALRRNNSMRT